MDRTARQNLIEQLREQTARLESAIRSTRHEAPIEDLSLVDLLEGRCWPSGWLVEWQSTKAGDGVATLALAVASSVIRDRGRLIVIDPTGEFYPPGVAGLGMPWDRFFVLRLADPPAVWWAWEHILRSEATTIVVGPMPQGTERQWVRLRWAADQGKSRGFFWHTPIQAPSAKVDLRLRVTPGSGSASPDPSERSWWVEVLSVRGPLQGKAAHVVLSHETYPLRLVAELAHSTKAPILARGKTG